MRVNFIVSTIKALWINEIGDKFMLDPYDFEQLRPEDKSTYNFRVAPFTRKNEHDLLIDDGYANSKYEKYCNIISSRLNKIHSKTYPINFWKKALSLHFLRYVTVSYDFFKSCELYFDPHSHTCNVLKIETCKIPEDFEEQRSILQNSQLGKEWLFSIYINLKFGNRYSKIDWPESSHHVTRSRNLKVRVKKLFSACLRSIKQFTSKQNNQIVTGENKDVVFGIFGTYFSEENTNKLITRSRNRIHKFSYPNFNYEHTQNVSKRSRKYLTNFESDFDTFDKFFFKSLQYCFPRVFLEDFSRIVNCIESYFRPYPNLKYLVSEVWINNCHASLAIALMQQKGVTHINNEHNALSHPFVGTFSDFIIENSDIFLTLGWQDNRKKIKAGASLYNFKQIETTGKGIDILFIAGPYQARMPNFCSLYSLCEEYVPRHMQFLTTFFDNLSILEKVVYRSYPKNYGMQLLIYNKEAQLLNYLSRCREINTDLAKAKSLIPRSKLVILDYISTSFLECLMTDIPTIFFKPVGTYQLKNEYKDFFLQLEQVGICQTDPVEAAKLVQEIHLDPNTWWNTSRVIRARTDFILNNIASEEHAIDYYLNLVK